jgi:hypothetical protein
LHDQFVKSKALAAGLGDSGASSLGEAESGNSDLGNFKNSLIISDSADDNGDSVSTDRRVIKVTNLLLGAKMFDQFGE